MPTSETVKKALLEERAKKAQEAADLEARIIARLKEPLPIGLVARRCDVSDTTVKRVARKHGIPIVRAVDCHNLGGSP
jgi:hypothetical protein